MLLAVDTSTQWIGLALYDGVQVISELVWQTQSHHTVELAPAVEGLLQRAGIQTRDLSALGVALGPGSFTSLRIGLAVVKGLSLAMRLPVVGIPSLDALAAAQPVVKMPLAAVLQAGRIRLAVGWYDVEGGHWKPQGEAKVTTLDELSSSIHSPTLVAGELGELERQVLGRKRKNVVLASPAQSLRRPSFLAELAWERWQAGKVDEVVSLAPIYLHVADPIPEP
ncbi:MAG: tRNA (adenosine(37)-N6)-threonylcarbamoyltransferase complex dimerization subunit type 1 TsaB [Anaerolineaceae bacterium]|nr:tRNA (adenosine(37)-N6)-threonylcarbamoyltransferase complex dimerization subunit type 1 TsaB [Anaerolineaceae bacterium]